MLNGQQAGKLNLEEINLKGKLNLLAELNNLIMVNNHLIAKLKDTDPLNTIEFVSNFSAIQTSIRNTFGFIRISNQASSTSNVAAASQMMLPPLPPGHMISQLSSHYQQQQPLNDCYSTELSIMCGESSINSNKHKASSNSSASTSRTNLHEGMFSPPDASMKKKLKTANECFDSVGGGANYAHFINNGEGSSEVSSTLTGSDCYNKSPSSSHVNQTDSSSSRYSPQGNSYDSGYKVKQCSSVMNLVSGTGNSGAMQPNYQLVEYNMKSSVQLTRSKMIYHCKFGEFGANNGQFTEPSGVTINTNNDIIVADTNSHRIQIFDKEGNFKFKFGECGKRDGQLLYPNRVSIVKHTGDIVVTERSPTHQIQIYNKYGVFLRKFGAAILQHPRGVYVDYKGRIVVVECKVMRVIIFDLNGNVLNKFNCSKYLEFPNGVCCSRPGPNDAFGEEIYISDNR
jgi:tripartite motif-containing protein 2/3